MKRNFIWRATDMEHLESRRNPESAAKRVEGAEERLAAVLQSETNDLRQLVSEERRAERNETENWLHRKRWKKAILHGLTFMALLSPELALAQRAQSEPDRREETRAAAVKTDAQREEEKKADEKIEKLRAEIGDKVFLEKVAYLRSVYGDAANHILNGVAFVENELRFASKDQSEDGKAYARGVLAASYDYFWDKSAVLARADARAAAHEKRREPVIAGFLDLPGWTNDDVKLALDALPRGFVANVDEIRYVASEKSTKHFDVAAEAEYVGSQGTLWRETGNVARFYRHSGAEDVSEVERTVWHEIAGHHNDFQASQRLTRRERVEMLYDVTRWLLDPERPRSDYVDEQTFAELTERGFDGGAVRLAQVRELWATSVEKNRKFFMPENAELKSELDRGEITVPNDLAMVNKWFNVMQGAESAPSGSQKEMRAGK